MNGQPRRSTRVTVGTKFTNGGPIFIVTAIKGRRYQWRNDSTGASDWGSLTTLQNSLRDGMAVNLADLPA